MAVSIFSWGILLVIGVFDAREYRIPNYLVITLLAVNSVVLVLEQFSRSAEEGISSHLYGFTVAFGVGLIFYSLKFMAAGDVKLIAAIGFILGHNAIFIWVQYFAVSCFFIGTMYWLLNRLQMQLTSKATNKKKNSFNFVNYFWIKGEVIKNGLKQKCNITYMPFAPVLIISLAMYQYFQH